MNEYKNSSTDFVENFLVASKGVSDDNNNNNNNNDDDDENNNDDDISNKELMQNACKMHAKCMQICF
jgi:hypothetical protein